MQNFQTDMRMSYIVSTKLSGAKSMEYRATVYTIT